MPTTIRWSDEEVDALCKMTNDGVPDKTIAEKLGRSLYAIRFRRSVLGVIKTRTKEFSFNSPIADYFPKWYKDYLLKRWQEEQSTSTK